MRIFKPDAGNTRFYVAAVKDWSPLVDATVRLALTEIAARSGGRAPVEKELARLKELWGRDDMAVWVCVDRSNRNDPICGMMTLQQGTDPFGAAVAFVVHGWIRKGYNSEPFDLAMPLLEARARASGCVAIVTTTERTCAAAKDERLSWRWWRHRWRAMAAYAKWAGRHGFRPRETRFEKDLTTP